MIKRLSNIIAENALISSSDTVLAAFSGGADSTALLIMLNGLKAILGFKLAAAHFNHGIRRETADADESFCADLCESLGIPYFSKKSDVPSHAAKFGLSIETAARLMRYEFLYETGKTIGACSIATAHHAEDNAESILMHIFRGSGIAGLCGMQLKSEIRLTDFVNEKKARGADGESCENRSVSVIRPLLGFKKSELIAFLNERGQGYRTDETNFTTDSVRNLIRLKIIPEIAEGVNKNAVNNILRLGEIASEDEAYLSSIAASALDKARCENGYLAKKLSALPSPVKKRAIRLALSENGALINAEQPHIEGIAALLTKQSGAAIDLPSARARMVFGKLIIEKRGSGSKIAVTGAYPNGCCEGVKNAATGEKTAEKSRYSLKMEEGVQKTPLGSFRLSFILPSSMEKSGKKEYNELTFSDPNVALMDRKKLNGELSVRTRQSGDRFNPLNSEWRMKLKDFFISRRVDPEIRDGLPLVLCGDEIVFIPSFLICNRVKLTEKTESILKIEYLGR